MKTKSLSVMFLLCMLMVQGSFAQANRERKTSQNSAYWDETGALICSCGVRITNNRYVENFEYEYQACPNCKLVWFAKIEYNNKWSKPYLKHNDKSKQKHECKIGICFKVEEIKYENRKHIKITRLGSCEEVIYCAFRLEYNGELAPSFAYILSAGEKVKEFPVDIRKHIILRNYYSHDKNEFYREFSADR